MNEQWSKRLIRFAAIFGLIGAVLGSHMAGSGSPGFRPIHAHVLVVGWLSLFAWGIYYKAFRIEASKLVAIQGWTGIIGSAGLVIGMWLQFLEPFGKMKAVSLPVYIGGGTILLISFALFVIVTFIGEKSSNK